jgi:hypothetical protein
MICSNALAVTIAETFTAPPGHQFRQTEIQNLGVASLSDKNVGRLYVAMHDSFGVRSIQCICNLNPQLQRLLKRQRLSGNALLQCLTVEKLHGDKLLAVLLADVVNGADVRVIERRCCLRFPPEPLERGRILGHLVR